MIAISFLPVLRRSCREDNRSRGQLTLAMEGLERWDLSAVGAAEAWIQKSQFPFTPSRRDHTTIPTRPSSQSLQGYSPGARLWRAGPPAPREGRTPPAQCSCRKRNLDFRGRGFADYLR